MKSGIYKITSPSGKIYIGQSIEIEERWRQYRVSLLSSRSQPALHNSFLKHGVRSHNFEVVELCQVDLLNRRERYWQDHYNVLNSEGLNCVLQSTTEKRRVVSEETKRLISQKNRERVLTPEQRRRLGENIKRSYEENPEKRIRCSERAKGCKWYNNGVEEIHSQEPREGFVLGRLAVGALNSKARPLVKMDARTLQVLKTYAVVRLAVEDGYNESGVRAALHRGCLHRGFKWCFVDKLPVAP